MELPNLLNKLKSTAKDSKKFIAIEIGADMVKTAIWQSSGSHTEVVSLGSVQSVSSPDLENLLSAIDTSLADAQASVAEEPDQVIFGLPEEWVTGSGLSAEKKGILKTVCQKMGLKPIGFVLSIEAIIHHLRDLEGGPPSAFLIRANTTEVVTSLVYLGKLEASYTVQRSAQFATDVEESIARLPHSGHLPSRMILIGDPNEGEAQKQELISYDWQKKLEFLHIPKVELLPLIWSIRAVAVAGGAEVVSTVGITELSKETPLPPPPKTEAADDFGFTTEIIDTPEPEAPVETPPVSSELENIEPVDQIPQAIVTPKKTSFVKWLSQHFKAVKRFSPSAVALAAIVLLLAAAGVGAWIGYTSIPHATIQVSVALNPFKQQMDFKVDPQATTTVAETLTIAGQKQSLEKSGSKTIPATGSKTVGERAKGKVIVYNRTSASKTFKAGEVIKIDSLKFAFDSSVTVASASTKENADFSLTTEPSKAEAQVTAVDIGDQFNIAKDVQLSVTNYSQDSFVAVAATGFTGGSSKKVAAVSKDDLETIKTALITELQQSLTAEVDQSQTGGMKILPVGDPEILTEEYSAKAGDAVDELTLNLSMSQTAYSYDVNELTWLAQQAAQNALPANVQIKPNSTQVDITESAIGENDVATIKSQVTIQYIPAIDVTQYQKALVNTSLKELDKRIQTIPNFISYQTTSSKGLIFNRLPIKPEQISLQIIPVSR